MKRAYILSWVGIAFIFLGLLYPTFLIAGFVSILFAAIVAGLNIAKAVDKYNSGDK